MKIKINVDLKSPHFLYFQNCIMRETAVQFNIYLFGFYIDVYHLFGYSSLSKRKPVLSIATACMSGLRKAFGGNPGNAGLSARFLPLK